MALLQDSAPRVGMGMDAFIRTVTSSAPKRFWGLRGAGILVRAEDTGRFLLGKRGDGVNEPGTWSLAGGKIDDDEDPQEAALRELAEETRYRGPISLTPLSTYEKGTFKFFNFLGSVPKEFKARTSWETSEWRWFEPGDFPSPLHFGMVALLKWAGLRKRQSGKDPFSQQVVERKRRYSVACNEHGLYLGRDSDGSVIWEDDPGKAQTFSHFQVVYDRPRIEDLAGCAITFEDP